MVKRILAVSTQDLMGRQMSLATGELVRNFGCKHLALISICGRAERPLLLDPSPDCLLLCFDAEGANAGLRPMQVDHLLAFLRSIHCARAPYLLLVQSPDGHCRAGAVAEVARRLCGLAPEAFIGDNAARHPLACVLELFIDAHPF